jgi:hypothetical protein
VVEKELRKTNILPVQMRASKNDGYGKYFLENPEHFQPTLEGIKITTSEIRFYCEQLTSKGIIKFCFFARNTINDALIRNFRFFSYTCFLTGHFANIPTHGWMGSTASTGRATN